MVNDVSLDNVSKRLGISTERLQSDISDTAWHLECLIKDRDQPVVTVLRYFAIVYMRGLGFRLGNFVNLRKHLPLLGDLCVEIIFYISRNADIYPAVISHIGTLEGVDKDIDSIIERHEIMDEVHKILTEKENK